MPNKKYDVFISHASEDKKEVALPLATLLIQAGLSVWLDEFELKIGDSLRRKIDHGLLSSRYGVVILSPAFFSKEWPQKEVDALVSREDGLQKVILPVWHTIDFSTIAKFSPILADRLATKTTKGLPLVANEILDAITSENPHLYTHTKKHAIAIPQPEEKTTSNSGLIAIQTHLSKFIDQLSNISDTEIKISGTSTGFYDLDRMINGLIPGELYILASRPSMGSTTLALNIASHVALNEGSPTIYFSPHNRADELVNRIISSTARIDRQRLARGLLTDEEWPRLAETIEYLNNSPLFIDDSAALDFTTIAERCKATLEKMGAIGFIVIDKLEIIENSEETSAASTTLRLLRTMARELNAPLILVTSILRIAESRNDKRPMLADLPLIEAIEKYATAVLFIYRNDFYFRESREPGVAEVIIARQRGGALGTVKLAFLREISRMESLAHDEP